MTYKDSASHGNLIKDSNSDSSRIDQTIQIYIHYSAMTEQIAQRRTNLFQFFLAINTIAIGLPVTFFEKLEFEGSLWPLYLSGVGMVFCLYWFMSVRSYRRVAWARWKVLNSIEQYLPISPSKTEHEITLEQRSRYILPSITTIESFIPFIFLSFYISILLMFFGVF